MLWCVLHRTLLPTRGVVFPCHRGGVSSTGPCYPREGWCFPATGVVCPPQDPVTHERGGVSLPQGWCVLHRTLLPTRGVVFPCHRGGVSSTGPCYPQEGWCFPATGVVCPPQDPNRDCVSKIKADNIIE